MKLDFPPNMHVGTSSWSSTDWYGVFYPPGIRPGEFISEYAKHFHTVEVDSTWHHMPSYSMVEAWNERTPPGFKFTAKVPQTISHEKYLVDCQSEMKTFLNVMEKLGDKLGPLLFQFPYVAKGKDEEEYRTGKDFLKRFKTFARTLPKEFRFAVEVRNATWIGNELLDMLRENGIALVFSAYYTMPSLARLQEQFDPVTTDFCYIRFLGNHKQMDSLIKKLKDEGKKERDWGEVIVDRTEELNRWIPAIRKVVDQGLESYVYFNNHYAGFAPGSIKLFHDLWKKQQE